MTLPAAAQYAVFAGVLLAAAPVLGTYMAAVYEDRPHPLRPVLGPLERGMYRLAGVHPEQEMGWQSYARSFLAFNLAGLVLLYLLQRLQGILPLNPAGLGPVESWTALNAAVSFASNTNWQSYSGEQTMSYLTQMLGLTVQNFVSAAAGMAVLVALIRGIARKESETVGNFWVDLVRSLLYILLPLALVWSLVLAAGGVVQTFDGPAAATTLEHQANGSATKGQRIARGPVASQVAIKQLGTNGGGFFNTNSAHPFENPSPTTGFLELLAILLIPAALCHTFGVMVGDTRQGRAVFAAMSIVFILLLAPTYMAEQAGNPGLSAPGVSQAAGAGSSGGNMEGKEVRFGISASALWAAATTAASNGSVNSMHDSFTPLGAMGPMWLMQLGEVIYGGVGSGLYGMLAFVVIAVFISGLMVGRTPEYMGKKIEAFEMKMAALVVLIPAAVVLVGTAVAVVVPAAASAVANPGPHGFSEILYAFSSAGNNNGSAFAGLGAGAPFYTVALALAMLVGRFWVAVPILAMAGSLAAKKKVAAGAGTLPTHRPLFVGLLVGVVVLVGALTYIPALALGPVAEHLLMGA